MAVHIPQFNCGSHRTTLRSWSSPSTIWVPRIKLKYQHLYLLSHLALCVAEDDYEVLILQPSPAKCWDDRCHYSGFVQCW